MAVNYAFMDLHLHLDGSLSLRTVKELAAMQGIEIPRNEEELLSMLQVGTDCRDLNEYLKKFDFPLSLLQTKEAIETAVTRLTEDLTEQGLFYAEIRFAPQLHTRNGLSQEEVVRAAVEGMKRGSLPSGLILCCMRGKDNHEKNLETVRLAGQYLGKGVCAVDLAGAEALYPTEDFEDVFALAKSLSVPFTIHAGEAAGPESVRKALDFGAKRIGHGVRSCEDQALLRRLSEEGIFLELCPTSNLNTRIFERMEDYPIRELMKAGVRVTVNTDNMTVSGITLKEEFQKLIEVFSLTEDELGELAENAFNAAFADKAVKEQWRARLTEYRIRSSEDGQRKCTGNW